MITNDAILRHNLISKVTLKSSSGELSKALKVKIMSMRIELGKVHKEFDADGKEFTEGIITPEVRELASKTNRNEEEQKTLDEMTQKINDEYNAYVQERLLKEVDVDNKTLTIDEYNEIVGVFNEESVTINNHKFTAEDYLEMLYNVFVTD